MARRRASATTPALVLFGLIVLLPIRSTLAAPSCAASCVERMAACRAEGCPAATGKDRRHCRDVCRAVTGCAAGAARIRGTIATVVNECRAAGGTYTTRQRLEIRRGDCPPVTVMAVEGGAPADDIANICQIYGQFRGGTAAHSVGAFQGVAVSADGKTVLFQLTNDFIGKLAIRGMRLPAPPFTLATEGIFIVNADGTDLHRIADQSQEPPFAVVSTDVFPFVDVNIKDSNGFSFSPDGRSVVFIDHGPGADGSYAPQFFTLDPRTGERRQLTTFTALSMGIAPTGLSLDGLFLDDRQIGGLIVDSTKGSRISVVPNFRVTGALSDVFELLFASQAAEPARYPGPIHEIFVQSGHDLLQLTSIGHEVPAPSARPPARPLRGRGGSSHGTEPVADLPTLQCRRTRRASPTAHTVQSHDDLSRWMPAARERRLHAGGLAQRTGPDDGNDRLRLELHAAGPDVREPTGLRRPTGRLGLSSAHQLSRHDDRRGRRRLRRATGTDRVPGAAQMTSPRASWLPVVLGRAGSGDLSSPRYDAEPTPPVDAIGLEVVVIDGKDRDQRLPSSQVDERRIGEVHGTVVILRHQGVECREIVVPDRRDRHRAGAKEPPRGGYLPSLVSDEMEQPGQDGRGRRDRQTEGREAGDTRRMPAIVGVEQCQQRARVREGLNPHGAASPCGGRAPAPARLDVDRHLEWYRTSSPPRRATALARRRAGRDGAREATRSPHRAVRRRPCSVPHVRLLRARPSCPETGASYRLRSSPCTTP